MLVGTTVAILALNRTATNSGPGDIRDATREDVEGFDAIIHLAAISNDPIGHLSPEATYSVNAHGAVHMAQMAKAAGFPVSCSRRRARYMAQLAISPSTSRAASTPSRRTAKAR
jgi:nucleoside-diphosphate-sugar epimerase